MAKTKESRDSAPTSPASPTSSDTQMPAADELGQRFVGQWNRLISTTNWEKGRIICQWRDALMAAGAPVSEYSDETWAQQVGGVSSQHVGRLRRVYQRFGEVAEQYEGLFWSHFQAGLDWEDAEMWLEGAIQNEWSVSQMRGKRWEVVGAPGEPMPEPAAAELDEDDVESSTSEPTDDAVTPTQAAVKNIEEKGASKEPNSAAPSSSETESPPAGADAAPARPKRERLAVEVEELPDDLAEAFEQFKLAIIAHRREGWSETDPDQVVECLDALRDLALAPLD